MRKLSFKINKLNFIRLIAAVIVGTFVGSLIIYAFQALGQVVFQPPFEYDPANPEIFRKLDSAGRNAVLVPILVSYVAGALVAGILAGVISRGTNVTASVITGLVLLLFGLVNLINFYHPLWFWIASLLTWPAMALAGGLLSSRVKRK